MQLLSNTGGRVDNDQADLTRATGEPNKKEADKSRSDGLESEDEDEEEDGDSEEVITSTASPAVRSTSASTTTITTTTTTVAPTTSRAPLFGVRAPLRSLPQVDPFQQQPGQANLNNSALSGANGGKKSAGAQVAEVIDRLVANRKGITPHIVVVAPLRNNKRKQANGDKMVDEQADVQMSSQSSNQHTESAFSAMAHHQQLLQEMTLKLKEQAEARSHPLASSTISAMLIRPTSTTTTTASPMPASTNKPNESTLSYEEDMVTNGDSKDADDMEDDTTDKEDRDDKEDEEDEDDTGAEEVKSAEKLDEVKNVAPSSGSLNKIKNAISLHKAEDHKKVLPQSKPVPTPKRKTAVELRAETLNKLRAKMKRPGGTAALFRALNRDSNGPRFHSASNSIAFPSLPKPTTASVPKPSKPNHVQALPSAFPMDIPNAVFLGAQLVDNNKNDDEDSLQAAASNSPNPPAKVAKGSPRMQAFTAREQLYSRASSSRSSAAVSAAISPLNRNTPQFVAPHSHNNIVQNKPLPQLNTMNPLQRSMHLAPPKPAYVPYGVSPNQRMQHAASFAPMQQLTNNNHNHHNGKQMMMMSPTNSGHDHMITSATGPQITLAQLAQLYPQQYLEFLQQHHPQFQQYASAQHAHHHQTMRTPKKSNEMQTDPMVAYQTQGSHSQQFVTHNNGNNMMMSMSGNKNHNQLNSMSAQSSSQMRPGTSVQLNGAGHKHASGTSPSAAFGENTAESVGHHQHMHSNQLLSGADSSNSASVNFNVDEGHEKGLSIGLGGGPSSGGAQLITSPMGIFKSLLLPLLPRPRMNLNGKVVFGVVLEKGVGFGKPKKPPIVLHTPHKHGFFGWNNPTTIFQLIPPSWNSCEMIVPVRGQHPFIVQLYISTKNTTFFQKD